MPNLNSVLRWLRKMRAKERRAANKYRLFPMGRVDMLSDLIEFEVLAWAKRNTEIGDLGVRCDKEDWKP